MTSLNEPVRPRWWLVVVLVAMAIAVGVWISYSLGSGWWDVLLALGPVGIGVLIVLPERYAAGSSRAFRISICILGTLVIAGGAFLLLADFPRDGWNYVGLGISLILGATMIRNSQESPLQG